MDLMLNGWSGPGLKRSAILGLMLFFALTGCTTLNREECEVVNWMDLGFEDGTQGHHSSRLTQHRKACAKHGVNTDAVTYMKGYSEGVRFFCRPENGYALGQKAATVKVVCAADLRSDFNSAYQAGLKLFHLRKEIAKIEAEISALVAEQEEIMSENHSIITELESSDMTAPKRKKLRRQLHHGREILYVIDDEIDSLDRDLKLLHHQLNHLQRIGFSQG